MIVQLIYENDGRGLIAQLYYEIDGRGLTAQFNYDIGGRIDCAAILRDWWKCG